MELKEAMTGLLDARKQLRSIQGRDDPNFMSKHMMRLASYTGAIEEHLSKYEKLYEKKRYKLYLEYAEKASSTAADNRAKAETAGLDGDIKKLTRLSSSSWKIVSTIQSRYNHLKEEIAGQET